MIETIPVVFSDISYYLHQYLDRYSFLLPLGIIGVWRWSVWMAKEVIGLNYHPKTKPYPAKVSIVTPVYNEDPRVFTAALISWKENNPSEIIAVIDYTDQTCIKIFKEFAKSFPGGKLIITHTPGKRPALADGIKEAKSEIVALVDSDTIWGKDVIRNALPPFHDNRMVGVATFQNVLHPKTFAQKIFDLQLDLRYHHEYPFLAAGGNALVCLSGRTAFYRRSIILPMLPKLVNEKFLGIPVISGDDKCLTYLVLAAGWKVTYQSNSKVYTPGMKDLRSYFKQRLRWTRNSLRADLQALIKGWPFKHPALFFFQIDKLLQSFVVVLSPIYFFIALYSHLWIAASVIFVWWFISRSVKMYPHLSRKPYNFPIIPGFVLYSFLTGVVKIYALFTLNTQGWITRWDKPRLPQLKILQAIPAYAATSIILILLTYLVYEYKQYTYFIPHEEKRELVSLALPTIATNDLASSAVILGASTTEGTQPNLLTRKYQTTENDNLADIAKKFAITEDQLIYANAAKLPHKEVLPPGTLLSIPTANLTLLPQPNLPYSLSPSIPLIVRYNKATNTLLVTGRGQRVTLSDIRDNGGQEYLKEVSPKVWYAKATIYIYHGVTLTLDKNEVTWLKLESNKKGFVMLRSLNGDILASGVKITSWDWEKNDYDRVLSDGRSFIMAKDNARMDFINSELAYLGFPTSADLVVSPYGVSWKLSRLKLKKVLLTGEVINSKFHHNYFGAFTFGATGMIWRGNKFYNNIKYGLDPHDDSNGFLVEENIAYNNGSHGIIFSKRNMYNVIRNNISYNNKLHGIMLHEVSDNNIIENNIVYGNTSGIALWHSSNNIVRNNTIKGNRHGVRLNADSNRNSIYNNRISGSNLYGIYLYDKAEDNLIGNNNFTDNKVAVYINSSNNQISSNTLTKNGVGVYFVDSASGNTVFENKIARSSLYGVYTKVARQLSNTFGYNNLYQNRKDIVGQ